MIHNLSNIPKVIFLNNDDRFLRDNTGSFISEDDIEETLRRAVYTKELWEKGEAERFNKENQLAIEKQLKGD